MCGETRNDKRKHFVPILVDEYPSTLRESCHGPSVVLGNNNNKHEKKQKFYSVLNSVHV